MSRRFLTSLEVIGVKLGLEQIRALVEALGRPDRAYPCVVVAGTNGKGSVTAMIERGLRAAGYKTGRYTSPHLVALEERFAIDGVEATASEVDGAADRVQAASRSLPAPPSYFEATTAIALEIFRDRGVDIAVLEVGLGGRLDATNVVTPVAVAITAIDFDHEQYLGNTIEAIAGEKAGVIKPGALVVLAQNPAAACRVVEDAAAGAGARLVPGTDGVSVDVVMRDGYAQIDLRTPRAQYSAVRLALRGRHQVDNAVTAVRLLEELNDRGFPVGPAAVRRALEDVVWPARLELLRWQGASVLIDGAHNPAGAAALASHLAETYGRRLPFVVGFMRDKKIDAMIGALAPAASRFVCTAAGTSRASDPEELAQIAADLAPPIPSEFVTPPIAALTRARVYGDPVVVAGSLYLAGEVRAKIVGGDAE